jgi:hypothetical protein
MAEASMLLQFISGAELMEDLALVSRLPKHALLVLHSSLSLQNSI